MIICVCTYTIAKSFDKDCEVSSHNLQKTVYFSTKQRVGIILCTILAHIEAALNALNSDWSQLSIAVACKCASTVFGIKFQGK